jgi:multidrug efflux pump subunit AcrB
MLKTYFSGSAVSVYRENDITIPIALRAGADTHQSLEGLTSASFAKDGRLISLAQIATLRTGFDFARIRRKNQERTITVTGRSASLTAGNLLKAIQPGLQARYLSGGYRLAIGGELQRARRRTNAWLPAFRRLLPSWCWQLSCSSTHFAAHY